MKVYCDRNELYKLACFILLVCKIQLYINVFYDRNAPQNPYYVLCFYGVNVFLIVFSLLFCFDFCFCFQLVMKVAGISLSSRKGRTTAIFAFN